MSDFHCLDVDLSPHTRAGARGKLVASMMRGSSLGGHWAACQVEPVQDNFGDTQRMAVWV